MTSILLALSEESQSVLWVGIMGIVVTVALAALGAYFGSVRSVGKIEVEMTKNHGETKASLTEVKTSLGDMRGWVETISQGHSPHIAEIRATLSQHKETLDDHGRRIHSVELKCAQTHPEDRTA